MSTKNIKMKILSIFFTFLLSFISLFTQASSGLVQIKSQFGFEETIQRFNAKAKRNGMEIIHMISHDRNAANVKKAAMITQAYAVDVSGGVESSPGIKDKRKITAFVSNAKSE